MVCISLKRYIELKDYLVKQVEQLTRPPAKRSLIVTLGERQREDTGTSVGRDATQHGGKMQSSNEALLTHTSPSFSFQILSKTTSRTKFTMS